MVLGSSSGTTSATSYPSTLGNISGIQVAAAVTSALGNISPGVNSILTHLNLASNVINQKNAILQEAMRRTIARRSADQTAQLDILGSLRNLESAVNITTGFIAASQNNPSGSAPVSNLQSISQVLSTFNSPSGSSFAVVNGSVVVTPPSVPAVSSNVQSVLNQGGVGLVTTSNLS